MTKWTTPCVLASRASTLLASYQCPQLFFFISRDRDFIQLQLMAAENNRTVVGIDSLERWQELLALFETTSTEATNNAAD